MGISGGDGVATEGLHAAVAALDSLGREDAFLAAGVGVGAGVDVLQRRYEIRLERLELTARLEAQLAAVKASDAAEAVEFQQAMTPPDASVHDRTYAEMSVVEEIAGVLTLSSAAANTTANGPRIRPPGMNHPAGPHPQGGTTNPNTPTPNQPTGRQESCQGKEAFWRKHSCFASLVSGRFQRQVQH